jgi:hypothetical protein
MTLARPSVANRYGIASPALVCGALLAAAVLLGTFLRLYFLSDQILIDDEWHGFFYVLGRNAAFLFTHFSIPGATCAPLHLYYHLLLGSVGWSEVLLRLPSIAAGVLGLVVLPLALRGILNRRALVIFGYLLAISPFLIFYSRFARPYSLEALFGFLAVIAFYRWVTTGRRRWAVLYVATGVLAVYFHLFGVVVVVCPAAAVLLVKWLGRRYPGFLAANASVPSAARMVAVVAAALGLSALLVLPAFINSARTSLGTIAGAGDPRQLSLWASLEMLAGTPHYLLVALVVLMLVIGGVTVAQRDRLLALCLGTTALGFVAALAVSKPHSMHAPIVVCRYAVPLFPMAFVLMGVGLDRLLSGLVAAVPAAEQSRIACLSNAVGGVFLFGLLWTGPLRQTYTPGCNFTSHAVFQDSYRPVDWRESFHSEMAPPDFLVDTTISEAEVSPFYAQLARLPDVAAIIEFPMLVGDHFNPYYYYQRFHRKRVLIGYSTTYPNPSALAAGHVFGDTYIDEVLSVVPDPKQLHFRNLVNVDATQAIAASGAGFLVIHRQFEAEFDRVARPHPCVPRVEQRCRETFGKPVFEDARLVVFRIGDARG